MINIRRANGYDADAIGELLKEWLNETNLNYPGYCAYSHVWLATFIYSDFCVVAVKDGKVIGTIGMKYGQFPWNNEWNAFFCDFLIVDKDNRTNGVGKMLIDEVKKLSDSTNVPIFLGIMTGHLADKKDRFLELCGFKYAGGNFVYGV